PERSEGMTSRWRFEDRKEKEEVKMVRGAVLLETSPGDRRVSPLTPDHTPPRDGGLMSSARNPGRVVGYWYLLLVLLGPLSLIYIPNKLFVQGDAAATASNIAVHEW